MKRPIGKLDPRHKDVHIWGGGFAGLLMASLLSRRGYRIHLYEKSSRLGGKLGTDVLPTGLAERAANAIYATAETRGFLRSLGLTPVEARTHLRRWIWLGKLTTPLAIPLLLRIAPRLLRRTPPLTPQLTIAEFFTPLLGERLVRDLVSAGLQGIYATDAHALTVLSLWPQFEGKVGLRYWQALRLLRGPRAQSVSFEQGMQQLVDALAASIRGEVHLGHQGPFELHPNTIICTSAGTAAELLREISPALSAELERIPYIPVSSVTIHGHAVNEWGLRGFGVLFPRGQGIDSLGCLFNHSIFPGRVRTPAHSSSTFVLSDTTAPAECVERDLKKLAWNLQPIEVRENRYPAGLPLYNEARWSAIKTLHQAQLPPGLVIFGNYVAGIGLRDMVSAASSFVAELGVE